MKKVLSLVILVCVAFGLAACSSKDANGIPNVLQDKYVGYSKDYGYSGTVFTDGSSELVFDKKKNTITDKTRDNTDYFEVIPEDKLDSKVKGAVVKHESELSGKDYFFIKVAYSKEDLANETMVYCVILTDGGKTIRIIELEHDMKTDGYYDFAGKAD